MDGPSCIPDDQQRSIISAVAEAVASQGNTSTHRPLVVVVPDAANTSILGDRHGEGEQQQHEGSTTHGENEGAPTEECQVSSNIYILKAPPPPGNGPAFKDQVAPAPSDTRTPGGGRGGGLLLADGISNLSHPTAAGTTSGVLLQLALPGEANNNNNNDTALEIHEAAPSLSLHQETSREQEPSLIPFANAEVQAIPISPTQIRNEQQIDDLESRLADEQRTRSVQRKRTIRCMIVTAIFAIAPLGFIAFIIGISIQDRIANRSYRYSEAYRRPDSINFLVSETSLAGTFSYDYEPLNWLIHRDPLQVGEDDAAKIIQRFAVASVYYDLVPGLPYQYRNWLNGTDECSWTGITCDDGVNVTSLDFSSLDLNGTISENIGLLSSLVNINVSRNNIDGALPSTLGLLSSLVVLDISWNVFLREPVLQSLPNLTNLEFFDASGVRFVETIPFLFASLTNLAHFSISDTLVSGTIPTELLLLTKLTHLEIDRTRIHGSIPDDLSKLTNLEYLSLGHNGLTGTAPSLVNCTRLRFLALEKSNLDGPLPEMPSSVQTIHFSNSSFAGSLPSSFIGLTDLSHISVSFNQLTGTLPKLAALAKLSHLDLQGNQLSGTVPTIGTLTKLDWLMLDKNEFVGPIPELSTLTVLQGLSLSHNRFNGTIPDLSTMSMLTFLDLAVNVLTGTIPRVIGLSLNDQAAHFDNNMSDFLTLSHLSFHGNNLTGTIPTSYASLTSLVHLDLSLNNFNGTIPPRFAALTTVQLFDIAKNMVTGSIPSALSTMTSLTWLGLHQNQLVGSLPTALGALTNLQQFSVNNNGLTGTIPTEYVRWSAIEHIWLQNTLIVGPMPFCNMTRFPSEVVADCGEIDDCPCCTICCSEPTANVSVNSTCLPAVLRY
jgi:Leucine-rich repeat (LRR) protein